ncbi:hypothetical protein [Luteibaculum oceani]|uniref:Lipoprotein n=1 Tax=Luteibaculum oceani TaxID=1294296 RepID=A0A5C6VAT3_9FLAO|nr:hypothetical protein [Luteibaculum oceani]TXC81934.1 hypothetical protein FRX97_02250 [Luteibaculum oceani]
MIRILSLFLVLFCLACNNAIPRFQDHVRIALIPFASGDTAYAMPELVKSEGLAPYHWRLSYLLTGVPKLHAPENRYKMDSIGSHYPDSNRVIRMFLEEYSKDERMVNAFETSIAAIMDPNFRKEKIYTMDEALEVASVFFYADQVNPDSTVRTKVCIGINGVEEAKWMDDRLLLEAFCYEAIFTEVIKDSSALDNMYDLHKRAVVKAAKDSLENLDQYLLDVRKNLMVEMRREPELRKRLREYYALHEKSLAFQLTGESE